MNNKLYNKILDILEHSRKQGSIDKYEAATKITELIHNMNIKKEIAKRENKNTYDWASYIL